jgi:hypothetical protein
VSTVLNVADALVATLNSTTLSLPITAQRLYVPNFDLEEISELRVSVVPREVVISALDRRRDFHEVAIDVAVQKKFAKGDAAEIDPLVSLVEEISEVFKHSRLDSFPAAIWARTQIVVLYSAEHWEQLRQFTSLLTLTFRIAR